MIIQIFEAIITGVTDAYELDRISMSVKTLTDNKIIVERFNLTDAQKGFESNNMINDYIKEKGVDSLPITLVDGKIVIVERYPSNEEFVRLLNVSRIIQSSSDCDCDDCTDCTDGSCSH